MIEREINWLRLENPEQVASPGLLVDPDRVAENIRQMIEVVGGETQAHRLRPHVKTHKMADVIRMQLDAGISHFKAATLAEAEMVAGVGPADILLAYQPLGPNVDRLVDLVDRFGESSFAAIVDDIGAVKSLAKRLGNRQPPLRLFIDVDCGMHRTGIPLGADMDRLRESIESTDGVQFAGLHVYDGHIHDASLEDRRNTATEIIETIRRYDQASPSPTIIGGGSPTFAIWAGGTPWQCSPGTPVFWDVGYGTDHPELPFSVATALLTRVISKPGTGRLCLDLGYKAVASEMPLDHRVVIPAIPDATFVGHSEEHLVIATATASSVSVGDAFLAFPRHICPTVALHAFASLIRDGRATGERWQVTARHR
jgi:D-serine deaminase-like pyridoxal phosphate-dependent protein